jgi:hypothetical protein
MPCLPACARFLGAPHSAPKILPRQSASKRPCLSRAMGGERRVSQTIQLPSLGVRLNLPVPFRFLMRFKPAGEPAHLRGRQFRDGFFYLLKLGHWGSLAFSAFPAKRAFSSCPHVTALACLALKRPAQPADHLRPAALVRLPGNFIAHVQQKLGQIIVPVQMRHFLRRQTPGRPLADLACA